MDIYVCQSLSKTGIYIYIYIYIYMYIYEDTIYRETQILG